MLSIDDATPFLLERGLIDRSWVIDGDLKIHCVARRNRNLRVEGPGGAGYLIKQPDSQAEGDHQTLRTEAAFYAFCQEEPAAAAMKRIVPRLAYCDVESALLALELVPDAMTLWWYYTAHDAQDFPVEVGRALGHALGTVHRILRQPDLSQVPRLSGLGCSVPWVMMVHKPGPELLASLSPANAQTIRILQKQDGLAKRLDVLRQGWRADTVIHGDIKSDNVLVWRSEVGPAYQIRIVDWEMVQLGDPAWDLAGALHDFVGFWVGSMPLSLGMTVEERVARARYPLDVIQAAIRSMWHGYQAATELTSAQADELMLRAVEFSAARMIQTAYEISYQLPHLSPRSVILLQISVNLLAEPELGRLQLYGIPLASSL